MLDIQQTFYIPKMCCFGMFLNLFPVIQHVVEGGGGRGREAGLRRWRVQSSPNLPTAIQASSTQDFIKYIEDSSANLKHVMPWWRKIEHKEETRVVLAGDHRLAVLKTLLVTRHSHLDTRHAANNKERAFLCQYKLLSWGKKKGREVPKSICVSISLE